MNREITCVPAQPEDFLSVQGLLVQLGYELSLAELEYNISEIRNCGGQVFVARFGDTVVGCVAAIIDVRLAGGKNGEIVSLVVDEQHRGKGIGQKLVSAAENWLVTNVKTVRVRANIKRDTAHVFYMNAGYEFSKSQKVFKKVL